MKWRRAGYGVAMRRSLWLWSAVLAIAGLSPLTFAGGPNAAAASTHGACRAPHLVGLTVVRARSRAQVAGCQLRFVGAAVRMANIQTVHTQNVRPGLVAKSLTVSVNPLCPSSGLIGPPQGEPITKLGTTELITGLFIEGGPFVYRSVPVCKDLVGTSSGGTISITNSLGTVIVNRTLSAGQLLHLSVQPGSYTVSGVFSDGLKGGKIIVDVPSGEVVRQDVVLDVP